MLKPMINIVGAGLSGLSAALTCAENGRHCRLISAQPSERAQSVLAEGGINAAMDVMGEGDTPQQHFEDTMRGGVDLADPNAVRGLTDGAPDVVRRLIALGAPLQHEGGWLVQRAFGGQKKRRTAYARSSTGKALMTTLIDAVRRYEAAGLVERYEHYAFYDLIIEDRRCVGVQVRERSDSPLLFFLPGPVLMCCGGLNGFFPGRTTGTTANTGDAASVLFARGVEMANLEFIQYHPTTIGISGKRCLISEAARGEGGRLFAERGGQKWYFMEELYPTLGNLMPRDVVSREMARVVTLPDCGNQVYLDMTHLSETVWKRRLPDLRDECRHYLSIDPASTPIPVEPGIHFFMGGIWVDARHRTSLNGLWAAGECASQYHGANRLGGNSMLAAIYGGSVAVGDMLSQPWTDVRIQYDSQVLDDDDRTTQPWADNRIGEILASALGIRRDEAGLNAGLAALDRFRADACINRRSQERIALARAMILSARFRTESRGAHTRLDYPERDEAQRKTTVVRFEDGQIDVRYRDLPQEVSK